MATPIMNDRKKAADFRRLALEYGIDFWTRADEKDKKELFFKLAPNLIPRLTEITGEDGEPLKVIVINYGDKITSPVRAEELPASSS